MLLFQDNLCPGFAASIAALGGWDGALRLIVGNVLIDIGAGNGS